MSLQYRNVQVYLTYLRSVWGILSTSETATQNATRNYWNQGAELNMYLLEEKRFLWAWREPLTTALGAEQLRCKNKKTQHPHVCSKALLINNRRHVSMNRVEPVKAASSSWLRILTALLCLFYPLSLARSLLLLRQQSRSRSAALHLISCSL